MTHQRFKVCTKSRSGTASVMGEGCFFKTSCIVLYHDILVQSIVHNVDAFSFLEV